MEETCNLKPHYGAISVFTLILVFFISYHFARKIHLGRKLAHIFIVNRPLLNALIYLIWNRAYTHTELRFITVSRGK